MKRLIAEMTGDEAVRSGIFAESVTIAWMATEATVAIVADTTPTAFSLSPLVSTEVP